MPAPVSPERGSWPDCWEVVFEVGLGASIFVVEGWGARGCDGGLGGMMAGIEDEVGGNVNGFKVDRWLIERKGI